jgi:hypothetical protein
MRREREKAVGKRGYLSDARDSGCSRLTDHHSVRTQLRDMCYGSLRCLERRPPSSHAYRINPDLFVLQAETEATRHGRAAGPPLSDDGEKPKGCMPEKRSAIV